MKSDFMKLGALITLVCMLAITPAVKWRVATSHREAKEFREALLESKDKWLPKPPASRHYRKHWSLHDSTTAFTGIAAALKRAYADGMVYGGNRLVERRIRAEADALEKGEFPKTVNSREELSSPEAKKKGLTSKQVWEHNLLVPCGLGVLQKPEGRVHLRNRMAKTSIQWTAGDDGSPGRTWNPTRGCSRVSPGCVNCYAERVAARFAFKNVTTGRGEVALVPNPDSPFRGFVTHVNGHPAWTGKVELIESKLTEPLHWKKPCRIFVNSMSDLFHEALPDEAIDRVFAVMALCPQHTFQVLTKRADRMRAWVSGVNCAERFTHINMAARMAMGVSSGAVLPTQRDGMVAGGWPLPNVWLGVSVEDQQRADERIPLLLQTPAAVRFVSYEPALGPVDFTGYLGSKCPECGRVMKRGWHDCTELECDGRPRPLLDWVIAGGESGPGARPFDLDWARSARDQCEAAGIAFFMKQVGSRPIFTWDPEKDAAPKLRDRKGGDMSEWPTWARVRQFPTCTSAHERTA